MYIPYVHFSLNAIMQIIDMNGTFNLISTIEINVHYTPGYFIQWNTN